MEEGEKQILQAQKEEKIKHQKMENQIVLKICVSFRNLLLF